MKNYFILLLLFYSYLLPAALYDPYYLSIECEQRINKVCAVFQDKIELFSFHIDIRPSIEKAILDARCDNKMLNIDFGKMQISYIDYILYSVPFKQKVYFLDQAISDKVFPLKTTCNSINFESTIVSVKNIESLLFYYKYIKLNDLKKKYWLTSDQRVYLDKIIKNGAKILYINLDAIDYTKPYRDIIPTKEVFQVLNSLN